MTNPRSTNDTRPAGIRRRDLMTGSLAGAVALASTRAWAQLGPTVPEHCVPPIPPGQPVAFSPVANAPMRVRKSAFELSPPEIEKLKSAYTALRNLAQQSPDDPRNWFHQGQVHCWYCSGALDGLWGQEIHGSWWFLPWHRSYLYFHEQILGSLIGDSTFALPYWDWDTPGRDRFPFDTYGQPSDASNPLSDKSRAIAPTDKIPAGFVGDRMMKRVLDAATFTDFGGSGDQSLGQNQMGILEGGPHGGVHVWTTDPKVDFNNPKPDMGVLASAAFDPVFFSHHANIDRIWDKWIKIPQSRHANPSNDVWLNQSFFFYDQAQNWTFIANNQMLEPEALSYRYQPPQQQPTPAVVAAAAPGPRPQVRLAQLPQLSAPVVDLSQSAGPKALTADPLSVRAAIPQESRQRLNAVGNMAAAPAGNEQHVILRIEGVEIPSDRGALVNVFVNKPDATAATSTDDPAFVGTIAVVANQARGVGHAHPVVRNFGFDITRIASQLGNTNEVTVTLVPATGYGEKPSAVNLRYNRVYIATRQ